MSAEVEAPVETGDDVEAQSESVEPDISQVHEDEVDASQTDVPTSEDETPTGEAEGQETVEQGEGEPDKQEEEEDEPAGAAGYGQPQPQQQTPGVDAELLSRAEQVGIPAQRARRLSPDVLRETVNELAWQQRGAAQQPVPVQSEQPKPLTVDDFKVGEEFTADELGEDTAKRLNALRDGAAEQAFRQDQTHRKQLENIEIALGGMVSQSQASSHQRDVDTFEAYVQGNKELHPFLGKGPMHSLKAGSEQAKLREQCLDYALKVLAPQYAKLGIRKTAADICDDATGVVLQKQLKSAARGEIVSKLKSRKGQAVGLPTQRTAPGKPTREEKAQARVDAWERAHEDDQPERP